MFRKMPLLAALAACSSLPAHAGSAVPAHPIMAALPACDNGPSWHDLCQITVPNGDFGGISGDSYKHDGSGGFEWLSVTPTLHTVRDHIKPWTYEASGPRPHLDSKSDEANGSHDRLVIFPGDRIYQWLNIPPPQPLYNDESPGTVNYTLHAHAAGVKADTQATIAVYAFRGGEQVDASVELDESIAAKRLPRHELGATLAVPEGTGVTRLLVAVGVPPGAKAPIEVDDVFVVRSAEGDDVSEMAPVW